MNYLRLDKEQGLQAIVSLEDIKMVHIITMSEPYTSSEGIQIIYKDSTTVTLFAKNDDFADAMLNIFNIIAGKLNAR